MRSEVSSQAVKQKDVETEEIREDFEPFVLEGSVSLDSDKVDPKPIKIMRHTCCALSMILEGSLPFSKVSATGKNVLIQGTGMDIISSPGRLPNQATLRESATSCQLGQYEIQNNPTMHYCNSNSPFPVFPF